MADDQSQRPYRSDSLPPRGRTSASGNDPLAELARLIGQTDPFGEFGRDTGHRAPQGRAAEPEAPPAVPDWLAAQTAAPVASAPAKATADYYPPRQPGARESQAFAEPNFGRPPFGGAPLAGGNDLYQVDTDPVAYAPDQHSGYEAADPSTRPGLGEDVYDDVPPPRRRIGIVAIAAVFALAVVGTAGAFGYRALFGSSGSKVPPPVIKAETAPSKVVPAGAGKDAQSGKLITDRVSGSGQDEKLVSREEQPVDIKDRVVGPAFAPEPGGNAAGAATAASVQPPLGSGVVGPEPKKIRTIAIHPDQATASQQATAAMPAPASQTPSAPVRVTNITPARTAPPPVATAPVAAAPVIEPPPRPVAPARPAPVQHQANAPLSLSPGAAAPAPARTASVAPTSLAPSSGNGGSAGGYAVQVSSQRSEADAQAAYRSLQGKFPTQLGSQPMFVRRVDLGSKGVYYRAMIGPFANGSQATELCSSLKAAGGQCLIQKN